VQTHKDSLGCTLRYLKYICSLNLMCLIHSFNTFIFTCSPTKQSGSYECGYYVMQWMLTIVQAAIKKGWDQVIHQYNKHSKILGL